MRNLMRNCQKVLYSLYEGKEANIDKNGRKTGTYSPKYSEIYSCFISVSPAQGASDTRDFGEFSDYDKTLSTTEELPIDELTRLWVDNIDETKPHDYIVTKVAKGINQFKYAIKKVKVEK